MCSEGRISSVHWSKADFLCKSELTGKQTSGPTVVPHVPPREPRIYPLTTKSGLVEWRGGDEGRGKM